jgi:hypothetical protein
MVEMTVDELAVQRVDYSDVLSGLWKGEQMEMRMEQNLAETKVTITVDLRVVNLEVLKDNGRVARLADWMDCKLV